MLAVAVVMPGINPARLQIRMKKKRRQQVTHEAVSARSDGFARHLVPDEDDQDLERVAQASRHAFGGPPGGETENYQKKCPHQPHHDHVLGDGDVDTEQLDPGQRGLKRVHGEPELELIGVQNVVEDVPADVDRLLAVRRGGLGVLGGGLQVLLGLDCGCHGSTLSPVLMISTWPWRTR
jgi:hypothetical protein